MMRRSGQRQLRVGDSDCLQPEYCAASEMYGDTRSGKRTRESRPSRAGGFLWRSDLGLRSSDSLQPRLSYWGLTPRRHGFAMHRLRRGGETLEIPESLCDFILHDADEQWLMPQKCPEFSRLPAPPTEGVINVKKTICARYSRSAEDSATRNYRRRQSVAEVDLGFAVRGTEFGQPFGVAISLLCLIGPAREYPCLSNGG